MFCHPLGKGKKVMIEKAPDEAKNDNVEPLPVGSKVIFIEAWGAPDHSPMHHHLHTSSSS
jgi:hypothetical protein